MYEKSIKIRKTILNSSDYVLNAPIELEYYLLDNGIDYHHELTKRRKYGIGISKKVNDNFYEEMFVRDFSSCKETTLKIIDSLADNDVTPITLKDIFEDILAE